MGQGSIEHTLGNVALSVREGHRSSSGKAGELLRLPGSSGIIMGFFNPGTLQGYVKVLKTTIVKVKATSPSARLRLSHNSACDQRFFLPESTLFPLSLQPGQTCVSVRKPSCPLPLLPLDPSRTFPSINCLHVERRLWVSFSEDPNTEARISLALAAMSELDGRVPG